MAKSIISEKKQCFICGARTWIESHHIFFGAYRHKAEKYGLKVPLCHWCHNEPPNGVHHNIGHCRRLQAYAQRKAMEHYGWDIETFRSVFGKNYLDEEG